MRPGIPLKNGAQFCDYIRFLQYSGAREAEAQQNGINPVDAQSLP
jgi:hypothetical protein